MKRVVFLCFVFSGAASIGYQLLWLRNVITYFGVITPVISSVLSVFMLGLAIGNFAFGKISRKMSGKQAIVTYALVELVIGLLAITVPALLRAGYGEMLMLDSSESSTYLFFSWAVITCALLPTCILIGATMPLMMRFLQESSDGQKNFGFLYIANLIGALIGSFSPLFLIEFLGFKAALHITILQNIIVAVLAFFVLKNYASAKVGKVKASKTALAIEWKYKVVLFVTGFAAIGSEVLWIKAFTPVVGTTVYSFAFVLAVYLISNVLGSHLYLKITKDNEKKLNIVTFLPVMSVLPILAISQFVLDAASAGAVLFIAPLCFIFGYLTPQIIDKACKGDSEKTAQAYMYNFTGCILGPLFTSYILFPILGLKFSLLVYCLMLILPVLLLVKNLKKEYLLPHLARFCVLLTWGILSSGVEDYIKNNGELRRDHVGYIGAKGGGMHKQLLVNGVGMTNLTTITKNMIHLPLAHNQNGKDVLVICMGMGTTLRSAATWPLESVTVVELSKGVTESFGYFHGNAAQVLNDPRVKVVVDDGRRYLNRTNQKYDVVTIDPPPPFKSSGSGLLYTAEFLSLIKSHLKEGGMLAHWIPQTHNSYVNNAIFAAVKKNFKYYRVLPSLEGWGVHILASDSPIEELTAKEFIARLPEKSRADLQEWQKESLEEVAEKSLKYIPEQDIKPSDKYMSDDNLLNEFFLFRPYKIGNQL